MLIKILIIFLWLPGLAWGDELLVDFKEESLPVLNEEFRQVRKACTDNATDITSNDTDITSIDARVTVLEAGSGFDTSVKARIDGAQSLLNGSFVKIDLDAEDIDAASEFASGTFTTTTIGTYFISAHLTGAGTGANDDMQVSICIGTGVLSIADSVAYGTGSVSDTENRATASISGIFALTAGDKAEMWGQAHGGVPAIIVNGTEVGATFLSIHRIQ